LRYYDETYTKKQQEGNNMYEIRSNLNKNRLYITVRGKLDVNEGKMFVNSALQEAKKLRPGFGTISDISEFIPASEEVRLLVQEGMNSLKSMGVGPVVRVVKQENAVVANQWQRSSRAAGYTADQAASQEEAEKKLDALVLSLN
jgi:hypothetical protein